MEEYRESIKKFVSTTVEKINEKLNNNEDFILYIGRETCPFCRRFVKKLDALVDEKGWKIFYINSIDPNQTDEIAKFRSTHNIPTVPGFMVHKNGNAEVVCDSSLPAEEIIAFVGE